MRALIAKNPNVAPGNVSVYTFKIEGKTLTMSDTRNSPGTAANSRTLTFVSLSETSIASINHTASLRNFAAVFHKKLLVLSRLIRFSLLGENLAPQSEVAGEYQRSKHWIPG